MWCARLLEVSDDASERIWKTKDDVTRFHRPTASSGPAAFALETARQTHVSLSLRIEAACQKRPSGFRVGAHVGNESDRRSRTWSRSQSRPAATSSRQCLVISLCPGHTHSHSRSLPLSHRVAPVCRTAAAATAATTTMQDKRKWIGTCTEEPSISRSFRRFVSDQATL